MARSTVFAAAATALAFALLLAPIVLGSGVDEDEEPAEAAHAGDSWSSRAPLPTPRKGSLAAELNGLIYLFGDAEMKGSADRYDPLTDDWSSLPAMPQPRWSPAVAALGGELYVISGGDFAPTKAFPEVFKFTPGGGWSNGSPIPTPRFQAAAVALGGKIYVIGGSDRTNWMPTMEVFDPQSGWSTAPPMPTGRAAPAAAVIDGKIYVAGGRDRQSTTFTKVEVFDPAAKSWSSVADMGTPRRGHGAAALGGKLYVFGGCNGAFRGDEMDGLLCGRYLTENEEFDPATGKWSARAPLPGSRAYFGTASTAEAAYVFGGEGNISGSETARYEPPSPVSLDRAEVDPSTGSLTVGGTLTLTGRALDITGSDIGGATFSWIVTGSAGTISGAIGKQVTFTATASGSATVKVTASYGGASKDAISTIMVADRTITTLKITPPSASINVSGTFSISAAAKDITGATVAASFAWSSSDPSVATVLPSSGPMVTVSGIGQGTATVRVTATFGNSTKDANAPITVLIVPDRETPTVSITSPVQDAKITTTFMLRGSASQGANASQLSKVEVRVDGGSWSSATGTQQWSRSIDPQALRWKAGSHRIDARAYDGDAHSPLASLDLDYAPGDENGSGNSTSSKRSFLPGAATLDTFGAIGLAALFASVLWSRRGRSRSAEAKGSGLSSVPRPRPR